MKALKAGAVVLLGVGSVLAGCQGGFRESVTPGVKTSTPANHPEWALNQKATLAYWSGLEKALKLARQLRRTPPRERTRLPGGGGSEYNYDDSVLKASYSYVSGIASLHAGGGHAGGGGVAGGGLVSRSRLSWEAVRSAVERMAVARRVPVAERFVAVYEAAAAAAAHRPAAAEYFNENADWWRELIPSGG